MDELDWTKALWDLVDRTYRTNPPNSPYTWGYLITGRERRLWDDTRIDLLTDRWAIEVDWASKWTEAVGQCLWYAANTDKEPGIVLLVKDFKAEAKYIYRCKTVCQKLNIKMWLVDTVKGEAIDSNGIRHKV